MLLIKGYTSTEVPHENSMFLFNRAIKNDDKSSVLIKSAPIKNSKACDLLKHEYEISQYIENDWGIKAIAFQQEKELMALIFEDFKGESLDSFIKNSPLELTNFLKIAINITTCILKMHKKGIIHKDIKPSNILINTFTNEVKIVDFSIASILSTEHIQALPNPATIEGTLPYLSPEQTGRMNRVVDSRSDLYSLGITFYEMITGHLPFSANDPLEWVYCHIAQTPNSPHNISPVIPKMISDIIMKLMAKVAEERYQTASGLKYDLEKCLEALETKKEIKPFVLGERDISGKFQIIQKLYGRENELSTLLNSFEQISKTGKSELVLISGYSGIGKTALVNELHKPIVKAAGFFISGKFDQYKRDIPYYTIAEAFKGLIKNILFEPENKITIWKHLLNQALGINGQIIIDIIPQLELIIGAQPPLAIVSPKEGEIRFNSVLEKFIQVFATHEHPLTIFLDDLQWADSASLKLIKQLITNPENEYILIVGAYRDNEVNSAHPLLITLDEIKNLHPTVNEITLHPLDKINVKQLIVDTLNCDLNSVVPLANLVYKKTGGNPFFIIQFLTTLSREKLLHFNEDKFQWEWDVKDIESKSYTDNVVDLMTEKIKQLDIQTQDTIKLASCMGSKFNKNILALVSAKTENEISNILKPAIEDGFLLSFDGHYEFLHDRIQQAAYSLLSNSEKNKAHCKIGNLLLKQTTDKDLDENIFVIVNHFSHTSDCLSDLNSKLNIARLNLRAGEKARASSAYQSAKNYFTTGISLLPDNSWETEHKLTFRLYLELSTCEYLLGNFDDAEKLFDNILVKLDSPIEKASVYNVRLELYQILGKFEEASVLGLNALTMLELPFPETDTDQAGYGELLQVQEQLKGVQIEDLLNKPSMTDPTHKAAMEILMNLFAPFYNARPQLLGLLTFRMTNYSLKFGNTASSPYAYLYYGILLGTGMGDYKQGQQFGEMALALNDKQEHQELSCKVLQTYGGLVHPWSNPIHTSLPYLNRSYLAGIETGDLIFSGFAIGVNTYLRIMCGHDLPTVYEEAEKYLNFFKRSQDEMMLHAHRVFMQHCLNLMGQTKEASSLSTKDYNETTALQEMQEKQFAYSYNWYYVVKMQLLYHSGLYKEALDIAVKIKDYIALVHFAQLSVPEFYFYYSLALAAEYPQAGDIEKAGFVELLKIHQDKMKKWADHCPENFLHKYLLISAEMGRILNEDSIEVMQLYEKAIKSALENKFIQNEALSYELASKYYQNKGLNVIAESYIKEAKNRYSRWGAKGKVHQIELNYPLLKEHSLASTTDSIGGLSVRHLDLHSIIKASQAISSPLEIEELTESLIRIVMEQAGARKGVLILVQKNQLTIAAEAILNGEITVKSFNPPEILHTNFLPEKIVQYVKRTKEKVIVKNFSKDETFNPGRNFEGKQLKSIACLPIIKQAKLIGMLYLENNLFEGAFTANKIDVLELLASQAAISIENVFFLEELKKSEMRLRLAMTQLPAVIWTTDASLRFTSTQGTLLNKLDLTPNRVIGTTLYEYFQTTDPNFLPIASHLKVLKGKSVKYEIEVIGYVWESYVEPLKNAKGEIVGCIGMAMDITERKKTEKEIQASEERFRRFAEINNEGVVIHDNGKIIEANPAFSKMFGYNEDEVIGMHAFQFTAPESIDTLNKNMRENTTPPFEVLGLRKDGSTFYTELQGRKIIYKDKDLRVTTVLDISSRKKAESELRESESKLKQAQKIASMGNWEWDIKKNVVSWSDELYEIFGVDPQEFKADYEGYLKFVHPEDREKVNSYIENALINKTSFEFDHRIQKRDGTERTIHSTGRLICDENDEPSKMYGIAHDVTEMKQAENEIKKLNAELEKRVIDRTAQLQAANKELEKANIIAEQSKTAKQMFLASMSHEIRTPLNSIIGFQQLLKDTPLNDEQQEYVESIDFAGRNLLIIINDILDLSKIESGKFEFDETEINISDITKSVITLVSNRAKEKNIKLFISQDPAIPNDLYGDSARLSQILLNLIGNAVKFTEKGEIKIITQLLEETKDRVLCEFLVEDTGIGIPENKLETIFESFSQASAATSQKYGGTGLGLTISKHLVEMQGGTIDVKSKVGKGSTFSFKLNFKKASSHHLIPNIGTPITKLKNEPDKKLSILLAEDVQLNQRLVTKIMEKWGHHLDIADNGKIAIEKIKLNDYDLILMDIQMPEMDGYQATTYIRSMADESKQSIPIIALTAHASHAEAEKCLNLGMNAYVAKPFNQQQLQNVINQLTFRK